MRAHKHVKKNINVHAYTGTHSQIMRKLTEDHTQCAHTSPTKHIQKTDFTSQKNHRFSQTNHRISHNNSDKTQTKHTHVRVHPQNLHTSKHLRQALLVSCSTHRLENCLHVVCRRAARSTGRRERGAGDSTSQRGESVTKNEHM